MPTNGKVAGLFAGIGGLELGLAQAGFHAELLCEIDASAQQVLAHRFPDVPITPDVTLLQSLPSVEILAAGFPCQDLSQAGNKVGILGERSGLVAHVLRLVEKARSKPNWILIENVSYMLRLDRGEAMRYLTSSLEAIGYRWAYRVVDARAFGVPQRRLRVILLASRSDDPRDVLFADDVDDESIVSYRLQGPLVVDLNGPNVVDDNEARSYGFYWTEGRIGIGWAVDAVPTIKGGSGLGIPSPPAVWRPATNDFGMPSVSDGERLQGFPVGWTNPIQSGRAAGARWRLLGNAVCAPVAAWVGSRLQAPRKYIARSESDFVAGTWPIAAYGSKGKVRAVRLSVWPLKSSGPVLSEFLQDPLIPLSHRAASGFLSRAKLSEKIRYAPAFLDALHRYVDSVNKNQQ